MPRTPKLTLRGARSAFFVSTGVVGVSSGVFPAIQVGDRSAICHPGDIFKYFVLFEKATVSRQKRAKNRYCREDFQMGVDPHLEVFAAFRVTHQQFPRNPRMQRDTKIQQHVQSLRCETSIASTPRLSLFRCNYYLLSTVIALLRA